MKSKEDYQWYRFFYTYWLLIDMSFGYPGYTPTSLTRNSNIKIIPFLFCFSRWRIPPPDHCFLFWKNDATCLMLMCVCLRLKKCTLLVSVIYKKCQYLFINDCFKHWMSFHKNVSVWYSRCLCVLIGFIHAVQRKTIS